jgi:tRNA threonylcarbamoyladenosine biosynthesis protein TsaB
MPSLRSLVAAHRTVLLIDSASASIQVGLWRCDRAADLPGSRERQPLDFARGPDPFDSAQGHPEPACGELVESVERMSLSNGSVDQPLPEAIWHASNQEAGIAIFVGVDAVLAQAGIDVTDLGALVFCEGPGSILGIRSAAMALRIWSAAGGLTVPAFAYRSLELIAHDLRRRGVTAPCAVLADARRDTWHWINVPVEGAIGPLQRVPTAGVAEFGGRLFTPAGFRVWAKPPGEVSIIPYDLADLWRHQGDADLLRAAPQPDAFLHEDATYTTWTPQIHRASSEARPLRHP